MDKEMTEREAFEAWLPGKVIPTDEYHQVRADGFYVVWQAACKWQRERDAETIAILRQALKNHAEEAARIPDVLFDGFAVYQVMDDRVKARTSPENVSDTLDAVVKLLRSPAYIAASKPE